MQQLIQQNFENNLLYLQEKHPLVYHKIVALENAIDNGHYIEKYALVYENGGFDIYETKAQRYLYEKDPLKYTNLLTQSVNKLKNENVFELFKGNSSFHLETLSQMCTLPKFIFFGVASGEHISQIHNNINAKHYLIVEDDLELFRLSLMSTPYYKIAQDSLLYLSVFDEAETFNKTAQEFIEREFYYNQYIKFLQLPSHNEEKLKLFHIKATSQSHLNFSYMSILEQYTKPLQLLKKNYNFLNLLQAQKNSVIKDKPTLLLAPGPSLGKNISWLQQNSDKFLLVALSATLPILYKENITPDILIHFDGFERSAKHYENIGIDTFLKETILLFSARTPQNIIDLFDKEKIFFFENGTSYKKDFGNFSAFCAGSAAYLILIALKVQKLYLLGLDLAVDAQTLQTHTESYAYNLKATTQEDMLSFRNSLVNTQGNLQQTIPTTPNFMLSIKAINEITQGLKEPMQEVFNLNDGALLQDTIPSEAQNIQLDTLISLDKMTLHQTILQSFQRCSEQTLTNKELSLVKQSRQFANSLLEPLQQQKIKSFQNEQAFLDSLIHLYQHVAPHAESQTIALVMQEYAHKNYPYIFDYCNSCEHINKIDAINQKLVQELLTITNTYIKAFNG